MPRCILSSPGSSTCSIAHGHLPWCWDTDAPKSGSVRRRDASQEVGSKILPQLHAVHSSPPASEAVPVPFWDPGADLRSNDKPGGALLGPHLGPTWIDSGESSGSVRLETDGNGTSKQLSLSASGWLVSSLRLLGRRENRRLWVSAWLASSWCPGPGWWCQPCLTLSHANAGSLSL